MEVEIRKRMRIDLDKLPLKRLHAIDEIGNEQFPLEKSNEEERLAAIRRVDFSSVVEKEKRKKEKDAKEEEEANKSKEGAAKTWQGLRENLSQAQDELRVILDLITTVETNDAVAVAGMQRPKQLPTESLSDIAVSAATKLQKLRHLGRYFKDSSKTMEQHVVKEARFYGSLIRLQQNWKVKRHRLGTGNEGYTFELSDNSLSSPSLSSLSLSSSSLSTIININQDSSGMLSIQLPQKTCKTLTLKFLGDDNTPCRPEKKSYFSNNEGLLNDEDVNISVKNTHLSLRDIHMALFTEQVFEMVNRETYSQSQVINVTGMREDLLQLVIGQDISLCLSLVSSNKEEREKEEREREKDGSQIIDSYNEDSESSYGSQLLPFDDKSIIMPKNDIKTGVLKPVNSLEIYLLSIFHNEYVSRSKLNSTGGLLGHFCMTVAHRLFSGKVLNVLENLVSRVPYLELISHPTWHSRTSSWSLCVKVPELKTIHGSQQKGNLGFGSKKGIRSKLETKVVVMDSEISLKAENCATIMASFNGGNNCNYEPNSLNTYSCDLDDLPMLLLQQVASQVIRWLHEEALVLGINASTDFLCLNLDVDQGETLSLIAHVNPEDASCISWCLLVLDSAALDDPKFALNSNPELDNKRVLGPLSLQTLFSVLMDLVSLSRTAANCR